MTEEQHIARAKKKLRDNSKPCGDCLLWTRKTDVYGRVMFKGKVTYAHRVSYRVHKGEIPDGMVVRHTCNNPLCVNPNHLLIGTQKENLQDMIDSGNSLRGGKNNMTKLTKEQVIFIKKSSMRGIDLANMFSVSRHTISKIRKGVNWKWVIV